MNNVYKTALLAALLSACNNQAGPNVLSDPADTVFTNGKIYTLDDTKPWVEYDVPRGVRGIYVTRVLEGSPADKAGLQVGDVIGAINNELATTKHVCDRLITESKGRARLLVYRYGIPIPVIIES